MYPYLKISLLSLLILCILPASAQKSQTFSSFDGVHIAYTEEGGGFPVFLLHGFISNGSSWQKTALRQRLVEKGYRVIIPDLRGNGASDKPHTEEAYANDAEIRDMMALADHLNLKAFSVVGYSRGSIVLARWLTMDTRIRKAVLGGMGLDFTNPDWPRRVMFQKAFSGEEEPNEVTLGAVEYARSIGGDLEILGLLQKYQPVTPVGELRKVTIPVLVIAGDQDKDNGEPAELAAAFSKGRLVIVPGDHDGTYHSEEFASQVVEFL